MNKKLYALSLFTALFTASHVHAQIQLPAVIRVATPDGYKTVNVPVPPVQVVKNLVEIAISAPTPISGLQAENNLMPESTLKTDFKKSAERLIVKMIRLTTQVLSIKGISLTKDGPAQVTYEVAPFQSHGWTTDGFVTDCWDCGSTPYVRERVAQVFNLKVGSLTSEIVTNNPRFAGRKLQRTSANMVTLNFMTEKDGVITIPFVIYEADTYHPFVADIAAQNDGEFGDQVYGTSQVVRIWGGFFAGMGSQLEKRLEDLLNIYPSRFYLTELNRLGVVTSPIGKKSLPAIFRAVQNTPVPGQSERLTKSQILGDIKPFIELSDSHLSF